MIRRRSLMLAAAVFCGALFLALPALASFSVIDAAGIQKLMKNEPKNVMILDVRTPGEWMQEGVIPGATLIAMRDVPRSLDRIPKGKKIVVVCATGSRSGAVASFLGDKLGYPSVSNYAAGMVDWVGRGLPVARP